MLFVATSRAEPEATSIGPSLGSNQITGLPLYVTDRRPQTDWDQPDLSETGFENCSPLSFSNDTDLTGSLDTGRATGAFDSDASLTLDTGLRGRAIDTVAVHPDGRTATFHANISDSLESGAAVAVPNAART